MTGKAERDVIPESHRDRVDEYRRIQRFIRRVRKLTREAEDRTVYALTFTYQDWARADWYFVQAHELAEAVAEAEGEGIWLMADHSESRRFHWHAVALSARPPEWFVSWWAKKTGASKDTTKITLVKGQDDRGSAKFEENLARAILYRCKDAPRLGLSLGARAVASGPLRRAWRKTVARRMADPYATVRLETVQPTETSTAVATTPELKPRAGRICARPGCGLPIPDTKPAHAKYHDDKCKARHFRERQRQARGGTGRPLPGPEGGNAPATEP